MKLYEDLIPKYFNCHSLFLLPTTTSEINGIITELKSQKAPGYDNIITGVKNSIPSNIIPVLEYFKF